MVYSSITGGPVIVVWLIVRLTPVGNSSSVPFAFLLGQRKGHAFVVSLLFDVGFVSV